jgi:hypothetical protein
MRGPLRLPLGGRLKRPHPKTRAYSEQALMIINFKNHQLKATGLNLGFLK